MGIQKVSSQPKPSMEHSNNKNNSSHDSKRARTQSLSGPSDSRLLELSVPLHNRSIEETEAQKKQRTDALSDAVKNLISCLGEDPEREGLLETPKRAAEAFLFWTKGYEENLVSSI